MKIYAKVEGRHYEFERPEVDSRQFVIRSVAKYCPLCLVGWSHMTCVKNEGTKDVWLDGYHSVAGQVCPRCARQAYYRPDCIPGSLLEEPQTNCQTVDDDLLDYLPIPLLRREFDLHYEFLVSKQDTQNASEPRATETGRWSGATSHVGQSRLPGIDHSGDQLITSRS